MEKRSADRWEKGKDNSWESKMVAPKDLRQVANSDLMMAVLWRLQKAAKPEIPKAYWLVEWMVPQKGRIMEKRKAH